MVSYQPSCSAFGDIKVSYLWWSRRSPVGRALLSAIAAG